MDSCERIHQPRVDLLLDWGEQLLQPRGFTISAGENAPAIDAVLIELFKHLTHLGHSLRGGIHLEHSKFQMDFVDHALGCAELALEASAFQHVADDGDLRSFLDFHVVV